MSASKMDLMDLEKSVATYKASSNEMVSHLLCIIRVLHSDLTDAEQQIAVLEAKGK